MDNPTKRPHDDGIPDNDVLIPAPPPEDEGMEPNGGEQNGDVSE